MTENYTDKSTSDILSLVLSVPSISNDYYSDAFQEMVNFQVNYTKTIMDNDNVVVIVDQYTKTYYKNRLPEDILITDEIYDIWMID